MQWDTILRGAKVFDGTGRAGEVVDVALRDGRIAALGEQLPDEAAVEVRDHHGGYLIPGLLDIHTHEDLEAELDPTLPEMVRHGTTSAIVGNCSIGLAFGAQRRGDDDPIVDCFARVENIPKTVLSAAADKATWSTPQEYLSHLDHLNLGANLAPFLPHSMLRIEVMGLADSVTRDPTEAELQQMEGLLEEAMQEGYVGMSTDGLPLHFLANQPHVDKRIPTQYASFEEYRRLTDVVRRHDRVWQMTPATDDGKLTLKLFMLTSGRLYKKPLKVTALAALDSTINRVTKAQALTMSHLMNSWILNGRLRMQSLAAPFRIYSEGVISPLAEANPLMRQLIETELEDVEARRSILEDPEFVEAFREMWSAGKSGFNLGHLRRKLRMEQQFLSRDLADMVVFRAPVSSWADQSMADIYTRYQAWLAGAPPHEDEAATFTALGRDIRDDGEFFVALLRHFDRDLHWHYVTANANPETIKRLLLHPKLMPGFNDSGAHVTNMAFYDGNLRALHIALNDSEALFATMVKRLTREPAEFFGLDAGKLEIGARADLAVLNPSALKAYDGEASIRYVYRDLFDCHQLVNRSDGVVSSVRVNGQEVWDGSTVVPARQGLGGKALRVA